MAFLLLQDATTSFALILAICLSPLYWQKINQQARRISFYQFRKQNHLYSSMCEVNISATTREVRR